MPSELQYLKKRGQTWWFQRGVPRVVQEAYGLGPMHSVNLKTHDMGVISPT